MIPACFKISGFKEVRQTKYLLYSTLARMGKQIYNISMERKVFIKNQYKKIRRSVHEVKARRNLC